MKSLLTIALFIVSAIFFTSILMTQKGAEKDSTTWQSHTSRISLTPTPSLTPIESGQATTLSPQASISPKEVPPTTKTEIVVTSPSILPKSGRVLGTTPTLPPTPASIFLSVTSPTDNQVVTTPLIAIVGKTLPNAEVFINDQTLQANTAGIFQTTIQLEIGENLVSISANDAQGNYSEKELIITYNK